MRLYIHWPFCRSRCSYCDFNSRVATQSLMAAYGETLVKEMKTWASLIRLGGQGLRSIYIGGGTPSCMSGEEVAALIDAASLAFGLDADAEVTVEINPATWEAGDFRHAVSGGVNRLSIGVQSLDDGALRRLSRTHDALEARRAVASALTSGARTVNADLMYALPAGSEDAFLSGLEEMSGMGVHHLSVYALTLESGTPLQRLVEQGTVVLPREEEAARQYLSAVEMLESKGFEHYEISNFCKPGHCCRHNLAYWRREEYLGVGAGAHSLLGGVRFRNQRSVLLYLRLLKAGELPVCGAEAVAEEEAREEMIMLGMRTARGVPERTIGGTREELRDLENCGLLTISGGRVRLTARGMLVSNAVMADILYRRG